MGPRNHVIDWVKIGQIDSQPRGGDNSVKQPFGQIYLDTCLMAGLVASDVTGASYEKRASCLFVKNITNVAGTLLTHLT